MAIRITPKLMAPHAGTASRRVVLLLLLAGARQARALADGHGARRALQPPHDTAGEWNLVLPGTGPPAGIDAANSPAPWSESIPPVKLDDAVSLFQGQHRKVCLTVEGGMGGLSNTVGLLNTALDYSLSKPGVEFVMPEIHPPGHDIEDSFSDMFGAGRSRGVEWVQLWRLQCPRHHDDTPSYFPNSSKTRVLNGDDCSIVDLEVGGTSDVVQQPGFGCQVLFVTSPHVMKWHFDYSRSGPLLYTMYWGAIGGYWPLPQKFPIDLTMHVRLGDVRGKEGSANYVVPEDYVNMMKALVHYVHPECLNVTLVTDGARSDSEVQAIQKAWTDAGTPNVKVWDHRTGAAISFDAMTHSRILLGGPSGFPRLAAVMSKAQFMLFLDDDSDSHPVWYLPRATNIPSHHAKDLPWMTKRVTSNSGLWELATQCREYLKGPE